MKTFEKVQINDLVRFWNSDNMNEEGIVTEVKKNTFVVTTIKCWIKDGVKCFYDAHHSFYKTGTKTHAHYNYGNAIKISTINY